MPVTSTAFFQASSGGALDVPENIDAESGSFGGNALPLPEGAAEEDPEGAEFAEAMSKGIERRTKTMRAGARLDFMVTSQSVFK